MPKFRIGERIRLCDYDGYSLYVKIGATAVVERNGSYVYIRWDRDGKSRGQNDGGYLESQFESIAPASPFEQDLQDYINGELHCAS